MWFLKKKALDSEEFKRLNHEIQMIWMEIDVITQRWKRKVKTPKEETPEETGGTRDPFDEVRKLNKDLNL